MIKIDPFKHFIRLPICHNRLFYYFGYRLVWNSTYVPPHCNKNIDFVFNLKREKSWGWNFKVRTIPNGVSYETAALILLSDFFYYHVWYFLIYWVKCWKKYPQVSPDILLWNNLIMINLMIYYFLILLSIHKQN